MRKVAGTEVAGTQTLSRAVAVLRELGTAGTDGLRLVDLQQLLGLTRPTTHRILAGLSHHGLVSQGATGRRYQLGPELVMLGRAAASQKLDLQKVCQQHIAKLAGETGDSAFLMERSGYELICVDLQTGSFPIKTMTAEIGTRRPLGAGSSGIVVLAELEPEEVDIALYAGRVALKNFRNTSLAAVRAALQLSRTSGYSLSDGMVLQSVRGLSVSIVDAGGPIGALCVASIRDRIPDDRIPVIVAALRREKSHVEQKLRQLHRPDPPPAGGSVRS
jgi:DNA-binding IclR family transcriptional regulator